MIAFTDSFQKKIKSAILEIRENGLNELEIPDSSGMVVVKGNYDAKRSGKAVVYPYEGEKYLIFEA